ncbi:hypothetical protein SAMN04487819_11691 [Actinopolyspora alba]|uniref:Uncharacterized protein n=1 Tax=Actinopolyspora alba TaxID=673379 RepID=A0A1I2BGC4_9ACTN|nr:hypothetical protein [Actinopolyspora alba]SFE55215.1 hypothetical protein SAMN04487819_11691 [Actinopolyspora alba]
MSIETVLEPPLPDLDDGDDDEPTLDLLVAVTEPDETRRGTVTQLPAEADLATVADEWVRALLAAAELRGPALAEAVRRRMADERNH